MMPSSNKRMAATAATVAVRTPSRMTAGVEKMQLARVVVVNRGVLGQRVEVKVTQVVDTLHHLVDERLTWLDALTSAGVVLLRVADAVDKPRQLLQFGPLPLAVGQLEVAVFALLDHEQEEVHGRDDRHCARR